MMSSSIKVRKAKAKDLEEIYAILKFYWLKGLILERTHEELHACIDQFYIAMNNTHIIGVISYHNYGKHLKEIRSLAVREDFSRKGAGSILLTTLIRNLRKEGHPKIFVLSYSPVFFEKNQFIRVEKDTLPEKIWKDCINCKDKENCGETALVYSQ